MDNQALAAVCQDIYHDFPEMNGIKPKISPYSGTMVLLIFSTQVSLPAGKSLTRTVRVVAEDNGKIVKVSTSH